MSIQLKRSLSSSIDSNYVLKQGQIGIDMTATKNSVDNPWKLKIGDGVSNWSTLPYFGESSGSSGIGDIISNATIDKTTRFKGISFWDTRTSSGTTYSDNVIYWEDHDNFTRLYIGYGDDTNNRGIGDVNIELRYNYGNQQYRGGMTISCVGDSPYLCAGGFVRYDYSPSFKSTTLYPDLGTSLSKFNRIYAVTGSIQSSDRSMKNSIHYISDGSVATVDENGVAQPAITFADIMEFLQVCEPATFLYNAPESIQDQPEFRQLGIIADDIESTTLFPYIGCRMYWEADEDRGIEAGSSLGLKPLPVAVAALTACKYLLLQIENIQSQLDNISK